MIYLQRLRTWAMNAKGLELDKMKSRSFIVSVKFSIKYVTKWTALSDPARVSRFKDVKCAPKISIG